MEKTLQFIVMIDSDLAVDALVTQCVDSLERAVRVKRHSFDFASNWLELSENEDFDHVSSKGDDGFLYLRYRMEATPQKRGITVDEQIAVARSLCECLSRNSTRVILCANFEDKLPQFAEKMEKQK